MRSRRSGKAKRIVKGTKRTLITNKYSKWLFVFETVLFVGVVDEYLESLITNLSIDFYLHVLLLMLSIGVLFTLTFSVIEPWTKELIIWTIRLNESKAVKFAVHLIILGLLYWLYAKVFFGRTIAVDLNIGVSTR